MTPPIRPRSGAENPNANPVSNPGSPPSIGTSSAGDSRRLSMKSRLFSLSKKRRTPEGRGELFVRALKRKVKVGATIDSKSKFIQAAQKGNIRKLQEALNRDHSLIRASDENGETALIHALIKGKVKAVRFLIESRADLVSGNGTDARIMALKTKNPDLIKAVLKDYYYQTKASPAGSGDSGSSALDIPLANGTTTLTIEAVKNGDLETLKFLIGKGANPNAVNNKGETALFKAAERGDKKMIDYLLKKGADIKRLNRNGESVLTRAIDSEQENVLDALITHSIKHDVSILNNAVMHALSTGNNRHASILFDRMPKYNKSNLVVLRTGQRETLLILAAKNGHAKILDFCLKSINKVKSPLSGINAVDDKGETALFKAVERGDSAMVSKLINAKASVDRISSSGESVLIKAIECGDADILSLLLNPAIKKNPQLYKEAFSYAVEKGKVNSISVLLNQLNKANKKELAKFYTQGPGVGHNLLTLAAKNGHTKVIDALLAPSYGFSVDQVDRVGFNRTPLMWAAINGNQDAVKTLLRKHADTQKKDIEGNTALMLGIRSGDINTVKRLLPKKAKTEAMDSSTSEDIRQALASLKDESKRQQMRSFLKTSIG